MKIVLFEGLSYYIQAVFRIEEIMSHSIHCRFLCFVLQRHLGIDIEFKHENLRTSQAASEGLDGLNLKMGHIISLSISMFGLASLHSRNDVVNFVHVPYFFE